MNEYNYIIIIIFKKNIFDKQKKNLKYMYVIPVIKQYLSFHSSFKKFIKQNNILKTEKN